MEIKKNKNIPKEVEGKGAVDWNAMSSSHYAWGVVFMIISAILLVLFFVELFAGLIVPFEFFDKYVLCVLLLSITLTGASGITTIYFSYYCGDNFAINGFIITLATTIPCAVLNVSLFVWMMANVFSPMALVNLLLSIFVSLSAFLLAYDMYVAHVDKKSYVLYIMVDNKVHYLKWNPEYECMEFIVSTDEEESFNTIAKNIELSTERKIVKQEIDKDTLVTATINNESSTERKIVKPGTNKGAITVKEEEKEKISNKVESGEPEGNDEGINECAGRKQDETEQEDNVVSQLIKDTQPEPEPEVEVPAPETKSERSSAQARKSKGNKETKKEDKKARFALPEPTEKEASPKLSKGGSRIVVDPKIPIRSSKTFQQAKPSEIENDEFENQFRLSQQRASKKLEEKKQTEPEDTSVYEKAGNKKEEKKQTKPGETSVDDKAGKKKEEKKKEEKKTAATDKGGKKKEEKKGSPAFKVVKAAEKGDEKGGEEEPEVDERSGKKLPEEKEEKKDTSPPAKATSPAVKAPTAPSGAKGMFAGLLGALGASKEPKKDESGKEDAKGSPSEERKSGGSGERGSEGIRSSLFNVFLKGVTRVVHSKQLETVTDYRFIKPDGKAEWKNTHFIFAIDCSGSMRGDRWSSVKNGLRKCLSDLRKMKDNVVTIFTFDSVINEHVSQVSPNDAISKHEKLPTTNGEDTDYNIAMQKIVSAMQDVDEKYKNYCRFVVFLSDGFGICPKEHVEKITELGKSSMKVVFYTIACVTDEETAMIEMAKGIKGEHYKILMPESAKIIFSQILGA